MELFPDSGIVNLQMQKRRRQINSTPKLINNRGQGEKYLNNTDLSGREQAKKWGITWIDDVG